MVPPPTVSRRARARWVWRSFLSGSTNRPGIKIRCKLVRTLAARMPNAAGDGLRRMVVARPGTGRTAGGQPIARRSRPINEAGKIRRCPATLSVGPQPPCRTRIGKDLPTPYYPDWVELGRRYPKARQAMMEIRDRASHAPFAKGKGMPDYSRMSLPSTSTCRTMTRRLMCSWRFGKWTRLWQRNVTPPSNPC